MTDAAPALRLEGVDVDLGGRAVLRDAALTVRSGELVVLLGPNGSGKSTLVRAAVGLVPARGTIELFGTPLTRFRDRRRLGYVPQRAGVTSGVPATVREVVLGGRLPRHPVLGLHGRADRRAAEEAVERVGLGDRLRTPFTELSGGQQQRVLIARALCDDPELLVMDEPTAGVDRDHTAQLATTLAGLAAEGVAILLVAHELGPLRPHVERAVVLEHGRVAYTGPCDAAPEEGHQHPHSSDPENLAPVPGEGVW
ncbi:MAG: metal ABC transporter ATP-binding protein [Aeromicrobium erythreum]